jgi:hypothetical protein
MKSEMIVIVSILLASSAAAAAAQIDAVAETPQPAPAQPIDAPEEQALREARAALAAQAVARAAGWRVHTRHDVVSSWAPRYRLDTSINPLGLEQQLWRAVDALPLYHRISLDGTLAIDEQTSVAIHFTGWGSVDLLADANGGIAAGDIAIGYVEVAHAALSAWAGRRFLTFGPPGGLHVDGGGVAVRSDLGVFAEAFVGRPVTPIRASLLGPQMDFTDPNAIAYGARVGYEQAGMLAIAAGYAELWGHGVVSTRAVDLVASWDPGVVHLETSVKLDALNVGVMQARAAVLLPVVREVSLDVDYLHVEPSRWIPAWSILSAFESDDYDEAMGGVTLRASRTFAVRAEGAARIYTRPTTGEIRAGYRADLSARTMPGPNGDPILRVQGSRRDDGVIGYTVITAGAAFDVVPSVIIAIDGAFAIDDAGARMTTIGRANLDLDVLRGFRIGGTFSVAHAPIADGELRAMLRARWDAEAPR